MRIIFVDDEKTALDTFLPNIIDRVDMECQFFIKDGNKAIEYARGNQIDLAFLDVVMKPIDGITLAKELIKINPMIQIVFITGYPDKVLDIEQAIPKKNYFDICFKPYESDKIQSILIRSKELLDKKMDVFFYTFGFFDMFVNGKAVYFNSSKAKELLALLVDANGSWVDMDYAISCLWPDKGADLGRRSYRDAVCRLRKILRSIRLENLVFFKRGQLAINKELAHSDLWDFYQKKCPYNGSYMKQYGWSTITELELENRK